MEEDYEVRTKQERLLKYARKGNIDGCKQLLDEGCDVNYVVWWESIYSSALYTAVDHGQLECVQFLLEHGADPNSGADYDNSLDTALLCALDHDYKDISRLLLKYGADPGPRAIFLASKYKDNGDIIQLIRNYGIDIKEPDGS
jgi:hypothetical protein